MKLLSLTSLQKSCLITWENLWFQPVSIKQVERRNFINDKWEYAWVYIYIYYLLTVCVCVFIHICVRLGERAGELSYILGRRLNKYLVKCLDISYYCYVWSLHIFRLDCNFFPSSTPFVLLSLGHFEYVRPFKILLMGSFQQRPVIIMSVFSIAGFYQYSEQFGWVIHTS